MRKKLLIILAVLAVAGLGLFLAASLIAERGIGYLLNVRHIPLKSLNVSSIGRDHLVLRGVALGENGELKADRADITIRWNGRQAEAFDIVLRQADITAQLQGGQLVLGGIERAWTDIMAAGEATSLHLTGDATLHYETNGAINGRTEKAQLTLQREGKNLLLPLTVNLTAEGKLNDAITFKGAAASAAKELQLAFTGNYDLAQKKGMVDWSSQPVAFRPDGFRFADLSPAYAGEVATFPMRLSAKGKLVLTPGDWVLTPNITFLELPLAPLLASILGEGSKVDGIVAGTVPLTITPERWRINPSTLGNKGGLTIAIGPDAAGAGMIAQHPQADVVMKALGNFQVEDMTLTSQSTDDHGGASLTWHFLGRNPDLYGGKKVDFTLAVHANLEDIWLSATSAEKLAEKANRGEKK
jgi:hypothetical protein